MKAALPCGTWRWLCTRSLFMDTAHLPRPDLTRYSPFSHGADVPAGAEIINPEDK